MRHDAKWTPAVIEWIAKDMEPLVGLRVDPMAGLGHLVADLMPPDSIWGIEIEPEWADCADWIHQGDALMPGYYPTNTERIFTSIDYGNRMSGNYLGSPCRTCKGRSVDYKRKVCSACNNSGSDAGRRQGYALSLGRELSPANLATQGWGRQWRLDHIRLFAVWAHVLDPGFNRLYLNVKDHYRTRTYTVNGEKVRRQELMGVPEWCVEILTGLGFSLAYEKRIKAPGYREGQNREARKPDERVFVFDLEDWHAGLTR